jgi:hypothetical protein
MRNPRGLPGRYRKTRRDSGDHHGDGKNLLPPQQERRGTKTSGHKGDNRQNRLTVRAEIEGDPGAECDRHPRQQSSRARFGANPGSQLVD